MDPAIAAHFDIRHQRCIRSQHAARTHPTIGPHTGSGRDGGSRVDTGAGVDMRPRRNPRRRVMAWGEFLEQLREGMGGLTAAQDGAIADGDSGSGHDRAGRRID